MAYTAVARTTVSEAGTRVDNLSTGTGVAGGAGTGLKFLNDGRKLLYINNTGVGTPNVVVLASATFRGVALTTSNQTIATVSGSQHVAGPFPADVYNDSDGYVRIYFTGSNETDVESVWINSE